MRKTYDHACRLFAALALVCCLAAVSRADDFTFAGAFTRDDEARLFAFNVVAESSVTIRTLSYEGGTDSSGRIIRGGGFSPVLAVFDLNDGGRLRALDAGFNEFPAPGADQSRDARLTLMLQPGRFAFSLTQYFNAPIGPFLSDGFLITDDPNFAGGFIDPLGEQRTGFFAVEVTNVAQAAPVPEPATMILLGTGLAGVAARVRRRQRG